MHHSTSVFVVLVLLGSAMGTPIENFQAVMEKCFAESGLIPDFSSVTSLNFMLVIPLPNQAFFDKIKGFGTCVMKGSKVLKRDGTIDVDFVLSGIPEDIPGKEEVVEAVTECCKHKGADDWETVSEVFGCVKDHVLSFLPDDE